MMTTSTVGDRINGNVIMLYKTLRSLMTFFLDLKGNKETTNCHWRGSIFYFSSYNQTDACALLDFLSSIIILVSNVLLCPEDKEAWSCIDPSFLFHYLFFFETDTSVLCLFSQLYTLSGTSRSVLQSDAFFLLVLHVSFILVLCRSLSAVKSRLESHEQHVVLCNDC